MAQHVTILGSSAIDLSLSSDIEIHPEADQVRFVHPSNGTEAVIAVDEMLQPGCKVTAWKPIDLKNLGGLVGHVDAGGGVMNQALALARIARKHGASVSIRVIDSAPAHSIIQDRCDAENIELISLGLHNLLVNLVICFADDKAVIRSPVIPEANNLDGMIRRRLLQSSARSSVAACVSSKDSVVISQLWNAARNATRYLQPNVALEQTSAQALITQAHMLACNVAELFELAAMLGVREHPVDEAAPAAPEVIAGLLAHLWKHYCFGSHIAAVTRGRHGCVIADRIHRRVHSIAVKTQNSLRVPTRNGTGDLWHAAWIFSREIESLREPHAAVAATELVAENLGLASGSYGLRVDHFKLPSQRIGKPSCGWGRLHSALPVCSLAGQPATD